MADYSEAILRDSSLVPAYVNRGLALLELKQYLPPRSPTLRRRRLRTGTILPSRQGEAWRVEGLQGAVEKPIPRFNLLSTMPRPWMSR